MKLPKKTLIAILSAFFIAGAVQASSVPVEEATPLSNRASVNIDNWQQQRANGLSHLQHIMPNIMAVNAQDVYNIDYQATDYSLYEIPSVAALIAHPAVSSMVVLKGNKVVMESYKAHIDRESTLSAQSSTKSIMYILLNKALSNGDIALDDKVEKYLPKIGAGFKGRTVGEVASMAINHNVAELAAYLGDEKALVMFDRDERMIGLRRNESGEALKDFIQDIELAPGASSNEWNGEMANYATINTSVLGLLVEKASGVSLAKQVRDMMHQVGGENTVYMGTDFDGVPMVGASFLFSPVDFARYGRLLIENKAQVQKDIQAAKNDGQPVPPEWAHVDSYYYKSAIINDYGIGHSGWAGQLIWADPQSDTVVAINSQMNSELPNPSAHSAKLYHAAIDVVKALRN
ncbi:serine hydrolase domain-containing protein [Vibrio maritimus]